ncbi:unnamed protein product [Cuscuta campestris]|uniref:Uncharacterized protein n=1 Tax=Cuscuta campestris TaxID=132261 RepID=A0A484M2W0_9ASTE|nr:unnamed protein product [Cuscuta campestris]
MYFRAMSLTIPESQYVMSSVDCSIGEYVLVWGESTFLYVFRLVIITFPSMVQFQSLYISNCGKSVSHSHIMEGTSRALSNTIKFVGLLGSHALGSNPRFMATAVDLGRELVRRKIRLTYGGGNIGLQGAVASTVYNNCGRVRGFIPGYIATSKFANFVISVTTGQPAVIWAYLHRFFTELQTV